MSYYSIKKDTLDDIADAIREKTGSTDTFTPAEMAEGIKGIMVGNDLSNAEDAYFGTPDASDVEYSTDFTSTAAYSRSTGWGYKFTVNETFSVQGFKLYYYWIAEMYVVIYDDATQLPVYSGKVSPTNPNGEGWFEARISTPFNLLAGNSYSICVGNTNRHGYTSSIVTSPKITIVNGYNPGSYDTTYPTWAKIEVGLISMMMGEPIGASIVTEHKIQKETLDDIADEVKRITGAGGTISPAQIITALQSVPAQTTE